MDDWFSEPNDAIIVRPGCRRTGRSIVTGLSGQMGSRERRSIGRSCRSIARYGICAKTIESESRDWTAGWKTMRGDGRLTVSGSAQGATRGARPSSQVRKGVGLHLARSHRRPALGEMARTPSTRTRAVHSDSSADPPGEIVACRLTWTCVTQRCAGPVALELHQTITGRDFATIADSPRTLLRATIQGSPPGGARAPH